VPKPKLADRDGIRFVLLVAASVAILTIVGVTGWKLLGRYGQAKNNGFRAPQGKLEGRRTGDEPRQSAAVTPTATEEVPHAAEPPPAAATTGPDVAALGQVVASELVAATGAPSALHRATRAAERDRDLPWRLPRQCKNESRSETFARLAYLASFVAAEVAQTTVHAHHEAPAEAIAVVHRDLASIHEQAIEYVGLSVRPAVVYVHPDADALRKHSCSGADAVAYYDGAIHLAADNALARAAHRGMRGLEGEIQKSLMHEYVHHVLVSNGIGRPIWLQESMAMHFAVEVSMDRTWLKNPLPLSQMVDLLPSTATPEIEAIFYRQAYGMWNFLHRLCIARATCKRSDLPAALLQGRATPEHLFEWAILERASDLVSTTPEAFFQDYVARGEAFSPETVMKLAARRTR
jgi:hypothetical protein